jgi:hypothetical protein
MPTVDDLNNLVLLGKAFPHKGQQQPVFLLAIVKERTSMASALERRTRQCHRMILLFHSLPPRAEPARPTLSSAVDTMARPGHLPTDHYDMPLPVERVLDTGTRNAI